jgi:hypothetical protein
MAIDGYAASRSKSPAGSVTRPSEIGNPLEELICRVQVFGLETFEK